jgi:hypothetical protein
MSSDQDPEIIVATLEDTFTYTELSVPKGRPKIPTSYFQRIEPIIFNELYTEEQRSSNLTDVGQEDSEEICLSTPLDICILSSCKNENGMVFMENVEFVVHRIKQVSLGNRKLRGRIRRSYPNMAEISSAFFDPNGYYICEQNFLGERRTDEWSDWVNITSGRKLVDMDWFNFMLEASFWLQARQERNWSISLSPVLDIGKTPSSVLLPTDPTGIRALLKERDKPAGKKRRSALLHWVKDHYRKSRNNPDDLIKVQEYMRGTLDFSWFGFQGKIIPTHQERQWLRDRDLRKGDIPRDFGHISRV